MTTTLPELPTLSAGGFLAATPDFEYREHFFYVDVNYECFKDAQFVTLTIQGQHNGEVQVVLIRNDDGV